MKKFLIILVMLFASIAQSAYAITDNGANDLAPTTQGTISGSELIQITAPATLSIIDFNVDGKSSHDKYVTDNANIKVHIKACGAGTIIITDQNGNVLWQYSKAGGGCEDFYPEIILPNGVGDYVLTATIDNSSGHSDSATIEIIFAPIISIPGTPDTGYYYLSGYAVSKNLVWLGAIMLVAIIALIIFKCAKIRRASATFSD